MVVNGKEYKLWGQFVEGKDKWIGGTLKDSGDSMDKAIFGGATHETKITDVTLKPNGEDSAFFSIEGEDFGCGFDVSTGGVTAGEEGWITFSGYGGHIFAIKAP